MSRHRISEHVELVKNQWLKGMNPYASQVWILNELRVCILLIKSDIPIIIFVCLFVSRKNLCANPQRATWSTHLQCLFLLQPLTRESSKDHRPSASVPEMMKVVPYVYPHSHILCCSRYHRMSEMSCGAVGSGSEPRQVDAWSILTHQT